MKKFFFYTLVIPMGYLLKFVCWLIVNLFPEKKQTVMITGKVETVRINYCYLIFENSIKVKFPHPTSFTKMPYYLAEVRAEEKHYSVEISYNLFLQFSKQIQNGILPDFSNKCLKDIIGPGYRAIL